MSLVARSDKSVAPSGSLSAALKNILTRDEFFAGLYILGCANGLLGRAIYFLNLEGWTGLAVAIDTNVLVLFACGAGISGILANERDEIRSADLVVGGVFLVLVSLPIFPMSWVAVTGLSIYILCFAKEANNSARKRGALILLALTAPMLWSRLLFQFFGKFILDIDAGLVASLLGTHRVGNVVAFADGSGYMVVTPACTSFSNISFSFLCWVTITQWAKHRFSPVDLIWLLLACGSVITVNVARIAITGLSQRNYELIHSNQSWGVILGMIILALTIAFSVVGARRELFSGA
jgi:hypothetical protein